MVELLTTDLLSPNMYAFVMMGTPRYLSVFVSSMIGSVAVLERQTLSHILLFLQWPVFMKTSLLGWC